MIVIDSDMSVSQLHLNGIYDNEIDFVGEKAGNKIYIQVSYKIEADKTLERELNTLLRINDNYRKYVVTLDEMAFGNVEGIEKIHLADFLLKEEW